MIVPLTVGAILWVVVALTFLYVHHDRKPKTYDRAYSPPDFLREVVDRPPSRCKSCGMSDAPCAAYGSCVFCVELAYLTSHLRTYGHRGEGALHHGEITY